METAIMQQAVKPRPATTFHQSAPPLHELKQLYLSDLRRDTHHRGRYVLLKITTPPTRMALFIHFLMEDEIGDTVSFHFRHQGEDLQPAVGPVSVGSACVIREPWYKMVTDGSCALDVDLVSDVTWLSKTDGRVPLKWRHGSNEVIKAAMQLKDRGNDALKKGKMQVAVQLYDAALQAATTPEEIRVIKLNRSLANLRIGCFDNALEDASEYTANAMIAEKGLYRAARSLYELRRFRDSHGVFKTLLAAYPSCEAARKELHRTEDRLREQDHGAFNFLLMHKATAENTPPALDVATYDRPVTIKMTEGRGRGLFTTRKAAAGDLLLCEKAFSLTYVENTSTTSLESAITLKGTPADLVKSTVHKLHRNPSQISSVVCLFHGTYEPIKETIVDRMPIVDEYEDCLLHNILYDSNLVRRLLISRIVSLNAFESLGATVLKRLSGVGVPKAERARSDRSCGLYIKASYVNHSCYSNAKRSFIGDVLILRATRDIPAGDEVLFWYTSPKADHSYEKTQERLRNWDFHCSCKICTYDKKLSNKKKMERAALLKEWDMAGNHIEGEAGLAARERLLAAIEQTYTVPAATVPRLTLWDFYHGLARLYASIGEPERTIITAWKVVAALGYVVKRDISSVFSSFRIEQWGLMVDGLIETWVLLWMAYEKLVPRHPELCEKAEEYARTTYKICVGEDDTFEGQVGNVARKAMHDGSDLGMTSLTL